MDPIIMVIKNTGHDTVQLIHATSWGAAAGYFEFID
jgi:hypothetical protein